MFGAVVNPPKAQKPQNISAVSGYQRRGVRIRSGTPSAGRMRDHNDGDSWTERGISSCSRTANRFCSSSESIVPERERDMCGAEMLKKGIGKKASKIIKILLLPAPVRGHILFYRKIVFSNLGGIQYDRAFP